jgi:hypothetical protein
VDDRDKDLTHLFVRDLDEIPLPARGTWRHVSGRETIVTRSSRYLLTAGAVVAVVAIALIVGFQLSQRRQSAATPSASPTPSPSGATAVNPSASPSATATEPPASGTPAAGGGIYNDDFGFVVLGQSATIRKESSNEPVATFAQQYFAVSPDGKLVAYWEPGPGAGGAGAQLRMFAAGGSSAEQALVTLAADQRGGGMAWSSDGAGLLYSTESGSAGIGGGPNSATLDLYELAANGRHGTTIVTETNTGWLYRPIAWDRSANLAAAALTGEGGFMGPYITVRLNADGSFTARRFDTAGTGMLISSILVSSDAKFVLGVELTSGNIRWWPLPDFAASKSQAGAGKRGALWRPGTHEIGFMSGEQLWLGNIDQAGSQGLCCTAFSGAPATSLLRTFRADGTAAVLYVPPTTSGPVVGGVQYVLVRIGSDPKSTSGDRVTFQEGSALVASVRFR